MAIIRPFRALRPTLEKAAEVSCVPYDVVSTAEARALAEGKPHSFMRVIRSEVEFPEETSPYADEIYQRARENFLALINDGIFEQDKEAGVYLYQIQMGAHTQTGVVCCSAVDDYDNSRIKLHEKTRPKKENDRTRHVLTLGAHAGPVFLTYKHTSELDSVVAQETKREADCEVTAEDGVLHRIWKAQDSETICTLFAEVDYTYVADGHHRAASASRARASLKESNQSHSGEEPYNFFLSVLFPDNQLQILPYNRIVKTSELSKDDVLARLSERFELEPGASPSPEKKGQLRMYLAGVWYSLLVREEVDRMLDDPVEALDVSLLQREVLAPMFGIEDPRTSENVEFIGGIRGTEELERLVDSGEAFCAFSLHHVEIDELFRIADAGLMMAPKSTWFEPKLRSGLLVHRFEDVTS